MLNFSGGTYLKSLCAYAQERLKMAPSHAGAELLPLIDNEIAKVRRNSDGIWGTTRSDCLFLIKLFQIKNYVCRTNAIDRLSALAEQLDSEMYDKIKVVFFAQETFCWMSFDGLYREMLADSRFEPQIVYIPMEHINVPKDIDNLMIYREKMSLPAYHFEEYPLPSESPDIAVFMKAYNNIPEQYCIESIEKVIPRSLYIQYGMEVGTEYVDFHFRLPLQFKAWRHVAYGRLLKENASKFGYRNGENVAVWGHPRADLYWDYKTKKQSVPRVWKEKINGRFCFLWTPHHSLDTTCGSYLDLKDAILSFFEINQDIFLIFRPHPMLFNNLISSGILSKEELELLKRRVLAMDNVILDTSSDYLPSFYASDAIITDASTFLFEYLYTGNPVIYTKKTENAIYDAERFEKGVYQILQSEDFRPLLRQISSGKDDLKDVRSRLKKNLLFVPESGKVSECILNNCYQDLLDELTTIEQKIGG